MIKTRRIFSVLLAFTLTAATFALGGCTKGNSTHKHKYSAWERVSATGNCEEDSYQRICLDCERTETRRGTAEDHVWATEYTYNETEHWLCCTLCNETKGESGHQDDGSSLCKDCGGVLPTAGVYYVLSEDGTYARVTGYDGVEMRVVINSTYEGVPVQAIDAGAFENEKGMTRIYFPTTLRSIGENAFYGCKNLMGAFIPASVTSIGDNAFNGCIDALFYCEAEEQPEGWSESWRENTYYAYWGRTQSNMTEVSLKAIAIGESMLNVNDLDRRQIVFNEDVGDVRAPEGFSLVTRFDAKTEGAFAWGKGKSAVWNYNFDGMNLAEYSDVWFAAKLVNAHWQFIDGKTPVIITPWTYFHFKQLGTNIYGIRQWRIEISVGGQKFVVFQEQSGSYIDDDRPANSIARMLWDEGFSSADKTAALIYSDSDERASFYCTEILGLKMGY